jgi:hypothetical protein
VIARSGVHLAASSAHPRPGLTARWVRRTSISRRLTSATHRRRAQHGLTCSGGVAKVVSPNGCLYRNVVEFRFNV